MTNAQIIFNASCDLVKEGILKTTGRVFTYTDDAGNVCRLEEPEPIHTYAAWQQLGRQVRKGEKSIAQIPIWKVGKGKKTTNEETGEEERAERMFMKTAFFFTFDQTDPITVPAT